MEALDTGSSTAAASPAHAFPSTATSSPSPSPSSASAVASSSSSSSASAGGPLPSSSDVSPRSSSFNAALARDASSLFHSSRYQECIDLLHQILLSDHENPKVIHNIAVVEYFRDGCADPQKLLDLLSKVKKKIEELCKKGVREQWDDVNALPSNSPSNANSSSSKASNVGTNTDIPAYLEDYDTSIPIFNSAVIFFHLQQYAAALTVLEPLYHNIEVIDEPAALRICGLMLDTALASCQPRKASDVLRYMERVFGLGILVTPSESGCNIPSHPMLLSSTLDSASSMGTGITGSLSNSTVPEASLTRSSSEEILDEEVLSLGLDMEGSNTVKSAAPISMLSHAVQGSPDRLLSAPPRDSSVKILLHLNKVRFFLCTRNIRAAKKEVKLAMNLAQGVDLSKTLMLKAQLEYLRGNYRKAVKLLMTCNGKEPGLRCMFLNNLGCIHHHLRKDSISYTYFHKALQSCISATSAKPLQISTFSQDKHVSILYNCGLQQLRSGNPILAAQCFQEAGSFYYRQPLLWLRIAECCISALEKGLLEHGGLDNSIKKEELRVSCVGEGKWRRLLLPAGSLNPSGPDIKPGLNLEEDITSSIFLAKGPEPVSFAKRHKLSLVFARQCLHNAFHLIGQLLARHGKGASETEAVDVEEAVSEDLKSPSLQNLKGSSGSGLPTNPNGNNKEGKVNSLSAIVASVTSFEEDQRKRNSTILQYVLADLAFVELCLHNPVRALKSTRQLLQHPDCTKPFRFLGHVYAAEALCLLNRLHEAAMELSACITECNNLETPANGGDEDGQKWKSGENSEASAEGDDGVSTGVAANASTLSEALSISSFTGTRARASLFVNLAMVHVMLRDLPQADRFAMQAVSITPANPLAVLCVVYVNLVQGRIQEAVALLKHCRHLCVKLG